MTISLFIVRWFFFCLRDSILGLDPEHVMITTRRIYIHISEFLDKLQNKHNLKTFDEHNLKFDSSWLNRQTPWSIIMDMLTNNPDIKFRILLQLISSNIFGITTIATKKEPKTKMLLKNVSMLSLAALIEYWKQYWNVISIVNKCKLSYQKKAHFLICKYSMVNFCWERAEVD